MKYEIDENNAIWGYAPEQELPCLFQPYRPDGSDWADTTEATAWAEAWIAHMNDPQNNPFPA